MPWKKSSPALIATFERVRPPAGEGVEHKQMFGFPCAFVNGQMFTGLHEESMILRLAPEDRAEFLTRPGAAIFEPMAGRSMKQYVRVPPALLADEEALGEWMARALAFARSLPPKLPKKR
jgi:TfoX/Sxy family transcriptional regulator of competence genes